MSGGSGVPELDETPKNVSSPECDRCGAAAVVTRGDLVLCGPCYYAETVRERRRPNPRAARPGASQIIGALEEIERALTEHLSRRGCACGKDGDANR
jgi:ribosomal protein S27AE